MKLKASFFFILVIIVVKSVAQYNVPKSYSNLYYDSRNVLVYKSTPSNLLAIEAISEYNIKSIVPVISGTSNGLQFSFKNEKLNGTLYYGFIDYTDSKFPFPVFFKLSSAISDGKAFINIMENLSGIYDMVGWEESLKATLGYRIVNNSGKILYDGKVSFKAKGTIEVDYTITSGPFINNVTEESVVISFATNKKCLAHVEIDGKRFSDTKPNYFHEIKIDKLIPATEYKYKVIYDENFLDFSFNTAPSPGTKTKFSFAYASDSRHANGGGERNLYGTNYYIVKRIMSVASQENVCFMQFTGDLVNGYVIDKNEMRLQYANWKSAVEPFTHYFPVYVGMGNHEALMHVFPDDKNGNRFLIDRFPFSTESAEALFAEAFVNPENGPESEDGSVYDPDSRSIDFPSYKENVYYYIYDNMAMVVLNSDYWYAPSLINSINTSGNLHGYLMDNQMIWLEKTLDKLEKNNDIEHVFITQHTPAFPNGGHVHDDMWYNGNNRPRAVIAGDPVKVGIIERRDEYLDLIINKSKKVKAIFTGDEHNYNKLLINPEMEMYPIDWEGDKLVLKRSLYQINNGAAGAPYYAQDEKTPWFEHVSGFTTQNAVVIVDVDGIYLKVRVINPDTLELIEEYKLEYEK